MNQTNRPLRGWRFVLPELDPEMEKEPTVSGLTISSQGGIGMIEGESVIRQSILTLISTVPGERIMRPEYGCDLHRLLFAANNETTAGLAIYYVRQALERWEPRIDILHLDAIRDPEQPEFLQIVLDYRVRATRHVDRLDFSINLASAEQVTTEI